MWASSKLGVHEERCDKYSNVTPKKKKKHKQKILPFLFRQLRLRLNTQSYFSFQNLPIQNAFNFNFQLAAHKTAVINFLKKIFYLMYGQFFLTLNTVFRCQPLTQFNSATRLLLKNMYCFNVMYKFYNYRVSSPFFFEKYAGLLLPNHKSL